MLIIQHCIQGTEPKRVLSVMLHIMPLYIWLTVAVLYPKDVYFFHPVVPLIHFCATISILLFAYICEPITPSSFEDFFYKILNFGFTFIFCVYPYVLRCTVPPHRTLLYLEGLPKAYGINASDETYNVCTHEDWTFPTSFFLPSSNYRMRLVQEFDEIMSAHSGDGKDSSSIETDYSNGPYIVDRHMLLNDKECHVIFNKDLRANKNGSELSLAEQSKEWEVFL